LALFEKSLRLSFRRILRRTVLNLLDINKLCLRKFALPDGKSVKKSKHTDFSNKA